MSKLIGIFFVSTVALSIQVYAASADDKQKAIQKVTTYTESQLKGKAFDVVTRVTGDACRSKTDDEATVRAAAIDQAKYLAHELGADGIANIQCGDEKGIAVRAGCDKLLTCRADAIKLRRSDAAGGSAPKLQGGASPTGSKEIPEAMRRSQ